MTRQIAQQRKSYLPAWLTGRLAREGVVRRAARKWVQHRDITIPTGVGAGLRFNAAASNPDYALGTNEQPVQEAFAHYLQPGAVVYDIGANVGFFTVISARLVGPAGHVYAFEPLPENTVTIRRNIALNNFQHVTVFEQAVSDTSGKGELMVAHYSGGSALTSATLPPDVKGSLPVELVTIDDLIHQQNLRPPTFVKIDVEGAEIAVLRGMIQTIQTYKPIIIYEIDDEHEADFQRKQEICDTFMRDAGYTITILEDAYPDIGWRVRNAVALPH